MIRIQFLVSTNRRVWKTSTVLKAYRSSFLSPNDFIPDNNNSVPTSTATTSTSSSTTATTATLKYEYNPNAVKLGVNLSKYGVNLSKMAHEGKLEAVIGRDTEIQQAIQILSRRRKNNPCLIGEPGVGKTSIAEGLANMICQGSVPESMKDKVIVSLDLASMVAGTKFRGEFEERLKGVLKEIEQAGDRIILFIDEMHTLVGAGGSEGAIDASNILKPSLARGQLRCMGTTTNDEYSRYIEKDAALARRFQSVYVPEPTEADTIKILKGLRGKYQSHHRVRITDEAIEAAVKLSGRYLASKRFPDKAIDLIDEAASRLRNRLESMPSRLVVVEKEIEGMQIKIEEDIMAQRDLSVKDELVLFRLMEERNGLYSKWKNQNNALGAIFEVEHEVNRLKEELKSSRRADNPDKDRLHQLVQDLKKNENLIGDMYSKLASLDDKTTEKFGNILGERDLAEIVSQSTGIPISSMIDKDDSKELLKMEDVLRKAIIGQDEAIAAIAKCIRLSRAGLRFHDRPMGVFLMLGPTGVGKTELAKAVSSFLFKDQPSSSSFLRIDMSEYMERFSVSRLIGAPPGYVGYEEGGVLTDAVHRRPYQLILLDEFEKAHREVSNLLLQVFDEGRLTDSQGRQVDFRNTVIIMTSNLGSDILAKFNNEKNASDGEKSEEDDKSIAEKTKAEIATKLVHQHFSPEFVNRLDEVVVFNPLSKEALRGICAIQIKKVKKLLADKHIEFHISDDAIETVTSRGTDLQYGARPLKRYIQNDILSPLASYILEGNILAHDKLYMSKVGESMNYMNQIFPEHKGKVEVLSIGSYAPGQAAKDSGLELAILRS